MIEVKGLTKYYGRLAAVKDVNFTVNSGEIVGFLGPNGAGKTTTMRILTCFSPPSDGEVKIDGLDIIKDSFNIRKKIGYLPENVPLYDWMRVERYLYFVAKIKGISSKQIDVEVNKVEKALDIFQVKHRIIKSLSKGFRQRVGLAQALIGDPPILILDEPTIGLDPRQIREIRQLIKGFSKNETVILSTHILPEVSQVCDRVMIINKGTIIAEDTPRDLAQSRGNTIRNQVTVRGPSQEIDVLLSALPTVHSVTMKSENNSESTMIVESDNSMELRPLIAKAIIEKGWDLLELRMLQATLEDIFIDLVTEEDESDLPPDNSESKEAIS